MLVALAGGFLLWTGSRPPSVSEPSGVFPNLLGRIALPVDPKTVSPVPMSGACDAGEKYRAAIDEYLKDARQYEKWHADAKAAMAAKPKAVELVVEAADRVAIASARYRAGGAGFADQMIALATAVALSHNVFDAALCLGILFGIFMALGLLVNFLAEL